MRCPYCKNEEDKVVDSRSSGDSIRRRRECLKCGRRFTTYEYIEATPVYIIKRDGTREPFQREKLLNGIQLSCKKRPIAQQDIENLVREIENEIVSTDSQEISYEVIGSLVMQKLIKLDHVAYVRFASVYREFKEVGEFVEQIRSILAKGQL
jgi:transcriptional repressor NrdR